MCLSRRIEGGSLIKPLRRGQKSFQGSENRAGRGRASPVSSADNWPRRTVGGETVSSQDLRHVNETYDMIQLPHIDGVLGCDVLVDYHAVIDLDKSELRIKTYK